MQLPFLTWSRASHVYLEVMISSLALWFFHVPYLPCTCWQLWFQRPALGQFCWLKHRSRPMPRMPLQAVLKIVVWTRKIQIFEQMEKRFKRPIGFESQELLGIPETSGLRWCPRRLVPPWLALAWEGPSLSWDELGPETAWCSFNRRLMRGWLLWQRQERGCVFVFVEQTSCYTIFVYRKAQKSNGSFSSLAIHHTYCDQTCAQYWTVRNCNTRNKETWRGSVARHVPAVEMAAGKACVILHGCCHIVGYCLRSVWEFAVLISTTWYLQHPSTDHVPLWPMGSWKAAAAETSEGLRVRCETTSWIFANSRLLLLDALQRWPRNWFLDGSFPACSEYGKKLKGVRKNRCAQATVLSLLVLLPWQLLAQWLLRPEERGEHPKPGPFQGGALQRSGHTGSISCHRFVTVEIQVTARAEVAPGEKVIGIDLGTTNSAVAAMEVLEPTRHVWTFVDVCG